MRKLTVILSFILISLSCFSEINVYKTTLVTPTNKAINQAPNLMLKWTAVAGAFNYDVQISNDTLFTSPVAYKTIYTAINASELMFGSQYFWRVKSYGLTDTSSWSDYGTFTTIEKVNSDTITIVKNIRAINAPLMNNNAIVNKNDTVKFIINNKDAFVNDSIFITIYNNDTVVKNKYYNYTISNNNKIIDTLKNGNTSLYLFSVNNKSFNKSNQNVINMDTTEMDSTFFININHSLVTNKTTDSYNVKDTAYIVLVNKAIIKNDSSKLVIINNEAVLTKVNVGDTIRANRLTNLGVTDTIIWSKMNGVKYFDYEIDTTNNFNSSLIVKSTVDGAKIKGAFNQLKFGTKYFWRVRARHTKDTTVWSKVINFTTLDTFNLKTPANNAVNQMPNALLTWDNLNGQLRYDYEIDTTKNFNSPIKQLYYGTVVNTNTTRLKALNFNTKYYWRVRARHDNDTSRWTSVRAFSTFDKVKLTSPKDSAVLNTLQPLLEWDTKITGVSKFELQYDDTISFATPEMVLLDSATFNFLPIKIYKGYTYYWRVRAVNQNYTSNWSMYSFSIPKNLGVENNEFISDMNIYPNPVVNNLNLVFNVVKSSNINYSITDITGKVLVNQNMSLNQGINNLEINTSSLSGGIYFINIDNGKNNVISKFIIEK